MRFITEQDIRTAFIRTPFEVYHLSTDTRLTPEARQFLIDRKITITDEEAEQLQKTTVIEVREKPDIELILSLFLLSVSLTVESDPVMAEKLSMLYQQMQEAHLLRTAKEIVDEVENVEITMFHVLLPRGKELAVLNLLQTQLSLLIADELKESLNKTMYNEFRRIRWELIRMMKKILGGEAT
ncbi:hypothetical protein JZO81_11165 [Enterococcus hulanensis]|uniref:hypothetical protein n=1 Tax=Enterococcus TaxID=1350 RepID=UPI000B5A6C21|nr:MULTISPECIES: hypothetical protein [Enterococcus]MBO0411623.1 hypothetical protein [Enterococcus hulanensis]OTO19286.1 hypothetical protein A5875_000617 [Enterococcus sp. 3H8_DIV0648]